MSRGLQVSANSQPETMHLADCVTGVEHSPDSAIDEFEAALVALAKTSGIIDAAAHPDVLAEMFIISAVSSTESYFRRLLSSLAAVCPLTAENIGREALNYSAAAAYPQELLSLALLERSLFSSKGIISKEIRRFTKFEASKHRELSAAIEAFETICQIRHAAAHWRGHLDSEGAKRLGVLVARGEVYRVKLNASLVQRAFAVCDHLVRLANQELFKFTLQQWVESRYMVLDGGDEGTDIARCEQLISVFGSTAYCAEERVTAQSLVEEMRTAP
ncbi:hypothetical protein AB0F39_36665 [Streptomyces murinus]|uniref:hypothetical protein n=1 Tax=Streptomyces murinus TaxID=33900 RepID=UPI0033EB9454